MSPPRSCIDIQGQDSNCYQLIKIVLIGKKCIMGRQKERDSIEKTVKIDHSHPRKRYQRIFTMGLLNI